jgi:DNA-3-methyladenine glycosylase II
MKLIEIEKGIVHLRKNDKVLNSLIKTIPNYYYEPRIDFVADLITAIINQQLSIKAAAKIEQRFFKKFGTDLNLEEILATDNNEIRSLGLSNAKVVYVKSIAKAFLFDEILHSEFNLMSDEEIIKELTKIKGVGEWTAHMFLMFTLVRPNVLPIGDLGLKRAIMINYDLTELPSPQKVKEISVLGGWAPYNTIACYYLWKSIDKPSAGSSIY